MEVGVRGVIKLSVANGCDRMRPAVGKVRLQDSVRQGQRFPEIALFNGEGGVPGKYFGFVGAVLGRGHVGELARRSSRRSSRRR